MFADSRALVRFKGELNQVTAYSDSLTVEEAYLRGIWNNLGVGKNGYIDIHELASVCKHIDMEEMNDTVSSSNHVHMNEQEKKNHLSEFVMKVNFILFENFQIQTLSEYVQ